MAILFEPVVLRVACAQTGLAEDGEFFDKLVGVGAFVHGIRSGGLYL